MSCGKKSLIVLSLTALLGLWGCAQSNSPSAGNARLRDLEAKSARLEEECKTVTTARDQARKKAAVLEEQRAQLQDEVDQLQRVARERDEFKQSLCNRTAERDALQGLLTQFGRDLQSLAQRVEQAANQTPAGLPTGVMPMPIATSPQDD
jgi:DNA anti-recombination protein RmuC